MPDKPEPNRSSFCTAIHILADYGAFTYSKSSGYELTSQDGRRLDSLVDDAVKAGRLTKGLWRKRVWLNFTAVARMGRAWLDHHHRNGTQNWDVIIAKFLLNVLVSCLGCRVGDAAWNEQYTGTEYLQYRHIDLILDGGEARWENLLARITLEYCKGHKD